MVSDFSCAWTDVPQASARPTPASTLVTILRIVFLPCAHSTVSCGPAAKAGPGSSSCDGASPVPGLLALPEMDRSLHFSIRFIGLDLVLPILAWRQALS